MNSLFIVSGAVLTASLFFGGGARRDIIGDLLPITLSIILIALAYPIARERLREDTFFRWLVIGTLILILIQFIPLPPALWSVLPGRGEILQMYIETGVAPPWGSLALRPSEAARSALSALPALAICLAVITLTMDERKKLVLIVLAFALLSALLGMIQIMGPQDSDLYFFENTNRGSAVGFFANRNHFAALFFCALPFAVAMFVSRTQIAGAPLWALGAIAGFVIVLGLSISGSRTALILGGVAIVASVLLVARGEIRDLLRGRFALAGAWLALILVLPLAMGAGLLTILERFETQDIAEDGRWTFAGVTFDAIRAFFPFGAGLGSFQQLYQLHEPANAVIAPIINHAHNDWLEVSLELGFPGLALALAFMVWLGLSWLKTDNDQDFERRLARAALLAIVLLAAHSIWDYPLRTIALASVFGLCCGLTFRPGEPREAHERPKRHRKRRRKTSSRRTPASSEAQVF